MLKKQLIVKFSNIIKRVKAKDKLKINIIKNLINNAKKHNL